MANLLILTVAGENKVDILPSLTQQLADDAIKVLDLGQMQIQDQVALTLLLQLPPAFTEDELVERLQPIEEVWQAHISYRELSEQEYQAWLQDKTPEHYQVTLLAPEINTKALSDVIAEVNQHGLAISHMKRLSQRQPVKSDNTDQVTCFELRLRGKPDDLVKFRQQLLHISSEQGVDLAIQEDSIFRRCHRLIAFDMDSTLIQTEVIDELAKAAGIGEQVAAITEQAMQGELDFNESFRRRMALLKGLDEAVLSEIAQRLPITPGAEKLIRTLKRLGFKTAILSGGFTYFAEYLQQHLGIDYVHANQLDIVDGKVTGEVKGTIVDGQRKAELLKILAKQEGVGLEQVIAVGDGANDLPMLGIAGMGVAFQAKPLVKASAKHAISYLGLDAILYLLGLTEHDIQQLS
ncbi:phosphoserine phosphatase SerB [Spartinivicinus ruber]|uniref:phosphoserine phosphatase SerB n=1 Tax=Spartinivicinus ruber TaxID=2683272 RepID=UPI0013D823FA|nr:phosphoserine phosphatase SerB [Spartinivicinus ruber]